MGRRGACWPSALLILAFACVCLLSAASFVSADCLTTTKAYTVANAVTNTATMANSVLTMTTPSNPTEASSVWLTPKLPMTNGFEIHFSVQISASPAEGFAFVFQGQSSAANVVGGYAGNLGYDIADSVAIEYDLYFDSNVDVSGTPHVQLHTRYDSTTANSAAEAILIPCATCWTSPPQINDSNVHTFVIKYAPPTISLTMDGAANPQFTVSLNQQKLNAMFSNGLAYFGFTASNSGTQNMVPTTSISAVNLYVYSVYPANTAPTAAAPYTSVASSSQPSNAALVLQLKDCNSNPLSSSVDAVISVVSVSSGASAAVVNQLNGQVSVYVWSTTVGTYTVSIKVTTAADTTGSTQSFQVNVVAGAPSSASTFTHPASLTAGITTTVRITALDQFSNPVPLSCSQYPGSTFTAALLISGQSTSSSPTVYCDPLFGGYYANFTSTFATTGGSSASISIRINSVDITQSPLSNLQILPGPFDATKSTLSGDALVQSVAGTTNAITLKLFDSNSNLATQTNGLGAVTLSYINQLTNVQVGQFSGTLTSNGTYTFQWRVTVAGAYKIQCFVGAVEITADANFFPNVVAAAPDATHSTIVATTTSAVAGSQYSFQIYSTDQYGNVRDVPNPSGYAFSMTLSQSGITNTYTCYDGTAVAASGNYPANNPSFTSVLCGYKSSTTKYFGQAIFYNTSGVVSITVALQGTSIGGASGGLSITVSPAAPSALTSNYALNKAAFTAGDSGFLAITLRDVYGNLITTNGLSVVQSFVFNIAIAGTSFSATQSSLAAGSSAGVYNQYFNVTKATYGSQVYSISVKFGNNALSATNGNTFTVSPGAINDALTVFDGPLTSGVYYNTPSSFNLYTFDVFGNAVPALAATASEYTITYSNGGSSSGSQIQAVSSTTVVNQYQVSVSGFPTAHQGNTASCQRSASGQTYNCQSFQFNVNSGSGAAGWAYGPGLFNAVAGTQAVISIIQTDANNATRNSNFLDYNAIFTLTSTAKAANAQPQMTGCSSSTSTNCPYTQITYTIQVAGKYQVHITAAGVEVNQTVSSPYYLTVAPGPISSNSIVTGPGTAVAGQPWQFNIQAVDAFNNVITTNPLSNGQSFTIVPSTGGSPLTASCTWDTTTLLFDCSATFTVATSGTTPIFRLPDNTIIQHGVSLTVVAGPLSGPQSSASAPLIQYAGFSSTVTLTPSDLYGNPITYTSSNQLSCAVQFLTQSVPATTTVTSGTVAVTLSYIPTLATTNTVFNLNCTDSAAPNSLQTVTGKSVTVHPGAPSATLSQFSGPSLLVAGTATTWTVLLVDAFGNHYSSSDLLSIVTSSLIPASDCALNAAQIADPDTTHKYTSAIDANVVAPDANGKSTLTFTPLLACHQYTAKLSVQATYPTSSGTIQSQSSFIVPIGDSPNNPAAALANSIVVIAGTPVAKSTAVILASNQVVAGTNTVATLQLADAYFNFVNSSGGSVTWNVYVSGVTSPCSTTVVPTSAAKYFTSTSLVDLHNGQYQLIINGTKAGSFYFVPRLSADTNSPDMVPCAGNPLAITIVPGPICYTCTLVASTNQAIAGATAVIQITLVDVFSNQLIYNARNPYSVVLSTSTTVAPGSPGGLCNSNGSPFNGTVPVDNLDSTFTSTTQTTTSGPFYVQLYVKSGTSYTLGALPNSCPIITIFPNYITNFTAPSFPPANTAGTPGTVTVNGVDQFQNGVYTHTYSYTTVFTRTSGTLAIDPYRVVLPSYWNSASGSTSASQSISYDLAYEGQYSVEISLNLDPNDPLVRTGQKVAPFQVYSFGPVTAYTCGLQTNNAKPYLCPDGTCAASWSACTGSAVSPVACSGTTCSGLNYCAASTALCPAVTDKSAPVLLAGQSVTCSDGSFRSTSADCPAALPASCPLGYALCPDNVSCARGTNTAQCQNLGLNSCPTGMFLCRSGGCATRLENCPTPTSCPAGATVLCGDGSCRQSASQCPDLTQCTDPQYPYRCFDGSCRAAFTDCPTGVSCPKGYARCENGWCAPSVQQCSTYGITATSSAPQCSLSMVRCPDSSCAPNILLCPSVRSCLFGQSKCWDGSCVSDVALCPSPQPCPTLRPYQCPDGSCAVNLTVCPTPKSCPHQHPVLCPDGSCAMNLTACAVPTSCPANRPIRCPDGSCATTLTYCPTVSSCPSTSPVKCPDGRCFPAADMCEPLSSAPLVGDAQLEIVLACPANTIRCPSGECAVSLGLCPSVQVCPPYQVRCRDGTCRAASECPTSVANAFDVATYVQCPQSDKGFSFANSLQNCATSPVCPPSAPVKCGDASCAVSLDDCPNQWAPLLNALSPSATSNPITYFPCPNGGWASQLSQCGQASSCPPNTPTKCWDESCRVLPEDCPPVKQCPIDAPYLCSDGSCRSTVDQLCQASVTLCDSTNPVRCPVPNTGSTLCVANSSMCVDLTQITTAVTASCSELRLRCKNGACGGLNCVAPTCPSYAPIMCPSGFCAVDSADCDAVSVGCPPGTSKCSDGSCSSSLSNCPATPSCPTIRPVLCPDGSCATSQLNCPTNSGCPSGQYRCWDGGCASAATGSGSCLSPFDDFNACPVERPFLCPDGYCAFSSYLCPKNPIAALLCPADMFPCADGSCVQFPIQCPILRPCNRPSFNQQTRCGDGTCRASSSQCPAATCPKLSGSSVPLHRCQSGYCVLPSTDGNPESNCFNEFTGCPNNQVRCSDGSCASSLTNCPAVQSGTGCASGLTKCWDGSCASSCSTPTTQSVHLNNCPATKPYRCADGSCALYPASVGFASDAATLSQSCSPVVVCESDRPFLCADGTCAPSGQYCPAVVSSCPAPLTWCAKSASCIPSTASCISSCPSSSPVLCPDGSCRTSTAYCNKQNYCPASVPFLCFDGTCATTPAKCISAQSCSSSTNVVCADGSCVSSISQCPLVPRCPTLYPQRCRDGSCIFNNATCPSTSANCATGQSLCEDGTCRTQCLNFDGCPLSAPYYCPGAYSQCSATECSTTNGGTATQEADLHIQAVSHSHSQLARHLLSVDQPSSTPTVAPGQFVCINDCQRNNVAVPQVVSVHPLLSTSIDVSFDIYGASASRLIVPAGSVSSVGAVTISPVSSSAVDSSGFPFAQKVLSTPFSCSLTNTTHNAPFVLTSGVDLLQYNPGASTGQTTKQVVPCFAKNVWSVTPELPSKDNSTCPGTITLTDTTISYQASCAAPGESLSFTGDLAALPVSANNHLYQNQVGSQCMCFNVNAASGTNPVFPVGSVFCAALDENLGRDPTLYAKIEFRSYRSSSFYMAAYQAGKDPCPPTGRLPTSQVRYLSASTDNLPSCQADTGNSAVKIIDPANVCLGQFNSKSWGCVRGDYDFRNNFRVNNGGPRFRATSQLVNCDGKSSYAFVNIDMPPAPTPPGSNCDWWCQYWKVVVGVVVGVGGFALISAYVVWRLIRYRRKYRETKKENIELKERAQELDQFYGGIGVADEEGEVAMVANPLVIEMQELEQQMKRVNQEMDTKKQMEVREIDQLDMERQRLHAEIERVRQLLAQQQTKKAPTRISDAPALAPRAYVSPQASTATVNPVVPQYTSSTAAPPVAQRQDFGQARGPMRKKGIE